MSSKEESVRLKDLEPVKDEELVSYEVKGTKAEEEGEVRDFEDKTTETMKIVFDGDNFLVRFPKEISRVMEIKKGDMVKFTAKPEKGAEKPTLKMEYLKG